MITILFKYFWVAFIIGTVVSAYTMRYRSKKYIDEAPELKLGYDKLFKGILIYGNVPWVIMGGGILAGITHGIFDYFNPKSLNPIVLLFHFSIIVLWILSVWWIYFNRGAEFIEKHPGFLQVHAFGSRTDVTAKQVKMFFPLALAGGIGGMIMMWVADIPSPPL